MMRLRQLISNEQGKISHTKTFASVAYIAATYAFLYRVHLQTDTNELWLIYLGIVASSATVSKMLALIYSTRTKIEEIKNKTIDNNNY